MRRPTLTAFAVAAALAIAMASGQAVADRETAKFQAVRADKALAAKKFEEAEGLYRKALEEDSTYLVAHYGLAQCFVGSGRSAEAVEALRLFAEGAKSATAPAEWKALLPKAEKQLTDLDAAGAALQKIADTYADGLVAMAERWVTKDPGLAERALRRALKAKPGHARAIQILGKMGKSAESETISLFDGKSLTGWDPANPPRWQVIDGVIVGVVRDAGLSTRSLQTFDGDFDVRADLKLLEEYPGPKLMALTPCWKNVDSYYQLGLFQSRFTFWDVTGPDAEREMVNRNPPDMKTPVDVTQWITFEMRFRGGEVTALVNGEVIGRDERPAHRQGGFVGLLVQNCKVAFRNIQVEKR